MLLEWRKRRAPQTEGLQGAALRKVQWTARRERLWMTVSTVASCVFIILITAEFIYARQSTALSPSEPIALQNGAVRIPVASVSDGNLHRFELQDEGVNVRFIVIQKPDHTLATAFDACAICGTQGYYQKGEEVVCRNCASAIVTATIGVKGGCNPIPIKSHVDGATLVIDASALEGGARLFGSGKAG
jgi:high-affinity iron transporter